TGLGTISEKAEIEEGTQRARWQEGAILLPPFRLEYLINGVMAYVERDPQVKTKAQLEKIYANQDVASGLSHDLITYLMEIGNDTSRDDFLWACDVVNRQLARVYRTEPKWRVGIQESDTFFFPLMAALGKAREQVAASQIEERKRAVVELV